MVLLTIANTSVQAWLKIAGILWVCLFVCFFHISCGIKAGHYKECVSLKAKLLAIMPS